MTIAELRIAALAEYLGCDVEELSAEGDETRISRGQDEYLVLTDAEADRACAERIRESVWAFNTGFLRAHVSLENQRALEALDQVRQAACEDANPLVLALVKDFNHLVEDAINADGRGHFLSLHDGEENRIVRDHVELFIYRQ